MGFANVPLKDFLDLISREIYLTTEKRITKILEDVLNSVTLRSLEAFFNKIGNVGKERPIFAHHSL